MLLTTHPDEAALMAGVIANPLDVAYRLAIADWYDENKQPERAEQIRVMIEHGEEMELQHTSTDWYFSLFGNTYRNLLAKGLRGYRWKRGFLYSVSVAHHVWERHAAEILAAHPLEVVRLTTLPWPFAEELSEWAQRWCSSRPWLFFEYACDQGVLRIGKYQYEIVTS